MQKSKPYSAIHKFLGWWVVIQDGNDRKHGQIIRTEDIYSIVRIDSGSWLGVETNVANSALLDPRIAQLHLSELSMQEAVRQ